MKSENKFKNRKAMIAVISVLLFIVISSSVFARPITDSIAGAFGGGLIQINNFFESRQYEPYSKAIDFFFFALLFTAVYMMGARYAFKEMKRPEQVIVILLGLMTAFLMVLADISATVLLPYIHWLFYVLLFTLYWWLLKGIKNPFWRFVLALLLTLLTIGLVQGLFSALQAPEISGIETPDSNLLGRIGKFFKDMFKGFGGISLPGVSAPGIPDYLKGYLPGTQPSGPETLPQTGTPTGVQQPGGTAPTTPEGPRRDWLKYWPWIVIPLLIVLMGLGGRRLWRRRRPRQQTQPTPEGPPRSLPELINEAIQKKTEAGDKIIASIKEKNRLLGQGNAKSGYVARLREIQEGDVANLFLDESGELLDREQGIIKDIIKQEIEFFKVLRSFGESERILLNSLPAWEMAIQQIIQNDNQKIEAQKIINIIKQVISENSPQETREHRRGILWLIAFCFNLEQKQNILAKELGSLLERPHIEDLVKGRFKQVLIDEQKLEEYHQQESQSIMLLLKRIALQIRLLRKLLEILTATPVTPPPGPTPSPPPTPPAGPTPSPTPPPTEYEYAEYEYHKPGEYPEYDKGGEYTEYGKGEYEYRHPGEYPEYEKGKSEYEYHAGEYEYHKPSEYPEYEYQQSSFNKQFSIIIPIQDKDHEVLETCLYRLRNATQPSKEVEIIVIDFESKNHNYSKYGEICKRYNAQIHRIERRGRLYNAGLLRNYGARLAKGDYFIFIDIEAVVPQNIFIVAERTLINKPNDLIIGRTFFDNKPRSSSFYRKLTIPQIKQLIAKDKLKLHISGLSSFIVTERSWFYEARGFDESYPHWDGLDNDFWYRSVFTNGKKIIYLDHLGHLADNIKLYSFVSVKAFDPHDIIIIRQFNEASSKPTGRIRKIIEAREAQRFENYSNRRSYVNSSNWGTNKIKVLRMINDLNLGGAEITTVDQCKVLVKNGFDVRLLITEPLYLKEFVKDLETNGVEVIINDKVSILGKNKGNYDKQVALKCRLEVINFYPEIAFITNVIQCADELNDMKKSVYNEIKFVYRVSGLSLMSIKNADSYKWVDLFIMLHRAMKDYFTRNVKNFSKTRTVILGNGISDKWFRIQPSRDNTVCITARMSPGKCLESFVRVINLVKVQIPDVHGIIIGGADKNYPRQVEVQDRVVSLIQNTDAPVTITGYTHNVEDYLSRGKAFMFTSASEGFPSSIWQAIAAGLIPVTTPIGNIPEQLKNKKYAYVSKSPKGNESYRLPEEIEYELATKCIQALKSTPDVNYIKNIAYPFNENLWARNLVLIMNNLARDKPIKEDWTPRGSVIYPETPENKKTIVCLEMDDASGKNKLDGKKAKLEDWVRLRDVLKKIGGFITIAIEPEKADPQVMKFLAENKNQFLPSVHGTSKYGHYGGQKTKEQIAQMWEWTVREIQKLGFEIDMDGNEFFIPPMHMLSENAIEVLRNYGVKAIGSNSSYFPLGSRDVRNSKGEPVFLLDNVINQYKPYKGVVFYKRFRPWAMGAGFSSRREIIEYINSADTSKRAKSFKGSYQDYINICVQDFINNCLGKDSTFYAHELNLGGQHPFIDVLDKIASLGLFKNVKFVNPKEFALYYAEKIQEPTTSSAAPPQSPPAPPREPPRPTPTPEPPKAEDGTPEIVIIKPIGDTDNKFEEGSTIVIEARTDNLHIPEDFSYHLKLMEKINGNREREIQTYRIKNGSIRITINSKNIGVPSLYRVFLRIMNVYPGDPEPNIDSNEITIIIGQRKENAYAEWAGIKALPRDNQVHLRNFLRKLFNKDWVAGQNPNVRLVSDIIRTLIESLDYVFERDPKFTLYVHTFLNPLTKQSLRFRNPELYQQLTAFENSSEYNVYKTAATMILNSIKGVFHEDRLPEEFKKHYKDIIAEFIKYFETPSYDFRQLQTNLIRIVGELENLEQRKRVA